MKTMLTTLACAAALCAGTTAQAGVITFNDPDQILITPDGTAIYTEVGFAISGPAASFLLLNDELVSGVDSNVSSLQPASGGVFSLLNLDYAFFDLGFGLPPGSLSIIGLLNGSQIAARTLSLGIGATASFGSPWANLTEVRFSGTTGFALDNINVSAVPEVGTLALACLALTALGLRTRANRRSRQADSPAIP